MLLGYHRRGIVALAARKGPVGVDMIALHVERNGLVAVENTTEHTASRVMRQRCIGRAQPDGLVHSVRDNIVDFTEVLPVTDAVEKATKSELWELAR